MRKTASTLDIPGRAGGGGSGRQAVGWGSSLASLPLLALIFTPGGEARQAHTYYLTKSFASACCVALQAEGRYRKGGGMLGGTS